MWFLSTCKEHLPSSTSSHSVHFRLNSVSGFCSIPYPVELVQMPRAMAAVAAQKLTLRTNVARKNVSTSKCRSNNLMSFSGESERWKTFSITSLSKVKSTMTTSSCLKRKLRIICFNSRKGMTQLLRLSISIWSTCSVAKILMIYSLIRTIIGLDGSYYNFLHMQIKLRRIVLTSQSMLRALTKLDYQWNPSPSLTICLTPSYSRRPSWCKDWSTMRAPKAKLPIT